MEVIFIVEAGVDYEGSSPVRAFAEKSDADAFANTCRDYEGTRPTFPADASTEEEIQAWAAGRDAWEAKHPGGNVGSPDWFTVIEVPFGAPAALPAQGHDKGGE